MERDVGSDHLVGYGEQGSVLAQDAAEDARLAARVEDAIGETIPDGPVTPDGAAARRATRARPRPDTDVSVHRSTRLAAAVLLPIFVLFELPVVVARATVAAARRCRRALSLAGGSVRRLLRPLARWLAKLRPAGARVLRIGATTVRSLARLTARVGSSVVDLLRPPARALGFALRVAGVVLAAAVAVVVWLLVRVGRALAIAGRAVGQVLARAGRVAWWVVVDIGRALAVPLGAVGRVVLAVGRGIGRVVLAVGRAVGRVVLAVGRGIGRVVLAVGRAVGHVVLAVGRAVGSALVAVVPPLRRAAAGLQTLARRLLRPVIAVIRPVGRFLAPAARLCRRVASRLGATSVALLRSLALRLDAWANAGRLAHGSARRRARRLAHAYRAEAGPVGGTHRGNAPAGAAAGAAQLSPHRSRHGSTGRVRDGVTFNAAVSQNAYLEIGGCVVDTVVTVSTAVARGLDDVTAPGMAEVILLDCSGSMGHPARKMAAARGATQAAVDALREGVAFAIVRCAGEAEVVYPNDGGLAVASRRTRDEAKAAAEALQAGGGTVMARWLLQARDLFMALPDAIHHALLLTDGRDEGETSADLADAVDACAGEYQCDCRGVGTDWDLAELRHVAAGLLGTVDIIPDPAGMEADFRAVTERAMRRVVDAVDLQVWTPNGAYVEFVRQITPSVEDLTAFESPLGPSTHEYATGAWGREDREYHIRVRVEPRPTGTEMVAARVRVAVGDATCAQAKVLATWTDDPMVSGHLDPVVARATGRTELATAIRRGLEARRRGDDTTATVLLGRAVELASETDNRDVGALLAKVVDVDSHSGTVTLRRRVPDVDEMALDTRSTKTVRTDR
jgi:Mg-chelatase subunit ChlD